MYNDNSIGYNIILNIMNESGENLIMFTSIPSSIILCWFFSRCLRLILNFNPNYILRFMNFNCFKNDKLVY